MRLVLGEKTVKKSEILRRRNRVFNNEVRKYEIL
jgi:hypothetical protein